MPPKQPTNPKRKKYSLRAKLLLFCASLLLTFLALEIGARIFAKLAIKQRVVTYDSLLGWKLIPHARKIDSSAEVPFLVAINSKGLRDKEYDYERAPDFFRLVVLGDSFAFGSGGVEQNEIFTEILEASLKKVEVINLGVPGYSTGQEFLYLKHEGLKYKPDLVFLFVFENDLNPIAMFYTPSIERPKGYFEKQGSDLKFYPPEFSWFYRASQHSYVLGLLERELKIMRRAYSSHPMRKASITDDEKAEVFGMLLVSMRDLCRASNAEFVVVNVPSRDPPQEPAVQRVAAELADSGEVDFIDLAKTEPFRDLETRELLFFETDIHLSPKGHEAAATLLRNYLKNRLGEKERDWKRQK